MVLFSNKKLDDNKGEIKLWSLKILSKFIDI